MSQSCHSLQHFEALFRSHDQLLTRYQAYWQLSPFQQAALPWTNPPLIAALASLNTEQIGRLEQQPQLAVAHFSEHFPGLQTGLDQWVLNPASHNTQATPFWLSNGIKGRKAEQIQAFSQQLQGETLPVLEWCAGKGHLGRLISFHHHLPVTSLEWQQSLCQAGEQLAQQLKLAQQFHHCDVLNSHSQQFLNSQQHVVALHACGELHLQLLRLAAIKKPQRLSLCPCCYHLIKDTHYQALSASAQQSSLSLSKQDLRLAVAQSVTSGQRVQTLRQREIHWRLSYQCLRESISGNANYQALPSVAKHWFSKDAPFKDFALWACQQHQLDLPAHFDQHQYLAQGAQRHHLVRQIELVQHLFRPLMERWLLLDRCLFLAQQGYSVALTELFPFQTSPRNVLIQAQLSSPQLNT
ncbi:SAM-dependent methyltransferase [Agarivorans sp. TSD2052]|uniref:methyltransferase n=1 Tax=Agarivorans sp. TSD2052 TaxID=2937286 RepID=UPI00200E40D0|nr:methyltransferase [Agarivorans sp. TSD2052]UPW18132.1 SAM-dependent methyltransferase [Agarivorans sp. TSD2052]